MRPLWKIFRLVAREQATALMRGAALGFLVLVMGVSLFGLSGWFITAAAAAGLAGTGAVFDVFRPSAMVRFLALGRAAARYGERLLTHDATLRALEVLRSRLLRGFVTAPYGRMIRIRGAQALSRLTADIDALDGVPLRLVLPIMAGLAAQMAAFVALWAFVGITMALWVTGGYLIGATLVFWQSARVAAPLSRRAEAAAQAFRSRVIDLIRTRRDLAVYGRLTAQFDQTLAADDRRLALRRQQDKGERLSGAALQLLGTLVAGGTLWLGVDMVQSNTLTPAFAAIGFFSALALAETIAPLRRAAADLGRMQEAARRVIGDATPAGPGADKEAPTGGILRIDDLSLNRPGTNAPIFEGLSFSVRPGETVALTGPSGVGKSTLLLAVAGLHPISGGEIILGDVSVEDAAEAPMRDVVTLLPQRSALMAGTVGDTLRLAAPDSDDETLWRALMAVQLSQLLRARDGLDTMIGAKGEGLSGGEARRLTLARAVLRQPKILLLDEPTEGLDDAMAMIVLEGLREILPNAAIVIAAHRKAEIAFADRTVRLK